MNNQLIISGLTVGYKAKAVLKNINISTAPNQLICLIGRNGGGKSTLLKTISGLLPSMGGSVLFNGTSLLTLEEKKRAQLLSIVLTNKISVGNITVKELVAFGRYPYTNWLGINKAIDYQEIDNAIQLCGIQSLENRNFTQLSDGEKQKVSIARSLAQNTSLILLDEPTVHLDWINRVEIFKLLSSLSKNQNKTIIVSTHQVELAMQLGDEVWFIKEGEVITGAPSEFAKEESLSQLFENSNNTQSTE